MNRFDWHSVLLTLLPGVGPARYWSYIRKFGCAKAVLDTPINNLPNLSDAAKIDLVNFQSQGKQSELYYRLESVLEKVEQADADLITQESENYPQLLKQTPQAPPVLFYRGNIDLLSMPQLAIVGTRRPTQVGIENTRAFSKHLAEGGFTITSGLALGVDGHAHQGALEAKGSTIAVMATGIEQIYPQRHQALAASIVDSNGLLLTEFFPNVAPKAENFPRRNRIISGLSLGVLVIEAAVKSGSLITARCSVEQNRDVFAIPGSIHNPQAKGCHRLIKSGARLVESAEDLMQDLRSGLNFFAHQSWAPSFQTKASSASSSSADHNDQSPGDLAKASESSIKNLASKQTHAKEKPEKESLVTKPIINLNPEETAIFQALGHEAASIDQLVERTGLSAAQVAVILMNFEMRQMVKHSHWGYELINSPITSELTPEI